MDKNRVFVYLYGGTVAVVIAPTVEEAGKQLTKRLGASINTCDLEEFGLDGFPRAYVLVRGLH